MTFDAVMWLVLLASGLALLGYLVAALLHPEKW
ncbi:potassium-transporting ATPase subunit F [Arthrobacter sp. KBS0703]|nr:potassium-transporting ATPase subunit F [Arthrobacter sp. KBS0703]